MPEALIDKLELRFFGITALVLVLQQSVHNSNTHSHTHPSVAAAPRN